MSIIARVLFIALCAYACAAVASMQFPEMLDCNQFSASSSGNHVQLRTIRDFGVCSRQGLLCEDSRATSQSAFITTFPASAIVQLGHLRQGGHWGAR